MDLKKNNIFIYDRDKYMSPMSLHKYIEFLDLAGSNFILFHNKESRLASGLRIKTVFYNNETMIETIKENSFRCDFILIEPESIDWCVSHMNGIEIPIIYITGSGDFKKYKNWDMALNFYGESSGQSISSILSAFSEKDPRKYFIHDVINGSKVTIDDIYLKHRRNVKLRDILGPST